MHRNSHEIMGLIRIDEHRGPLLRTLCPACWRARWIETDEAVCRLCRYGRDRARKRGGVLMFVSGVALFAATLLIQPAWPLAVTGLMLSASLLYCGGQRIAEPQRL